MEELVQFWLQRIEADGAYQAAARLARSKKKGRFLALSNAIAPYDSRIKEDMAQRGVDRSTLADCLGSRERADEALSAFGIDFIMRVEHEGFETLSEDEKCRCRSQHVLAGMIWERVTQDMLCR